MWPYKVYCGNGHCVCITCLPELREKEENCSICREPLRKTLNEVSLMSKRKEVTYANYIHITEEEISRGVICRKTYVRVPQPSENVRRLCPDNESRIKWVMKFAPLVDSISL